jgi:hypothetical protein
MIRLPKNVKELMAAFVWTIVANEERLKDENEAQGFRISLESSTQSYIIESSSSYHRFCLFRAQHLSY